MHDGDPKDPQKYSVKIPGILPICFTFFKFTRFNPLIGTGLREFSLYASDFAVY
jgi:hypothetical protein